MNSKYLEFLKSKIETAPVSGFSVPEKDINPALKPHQRYSEENPKDFSLPVPGLYSCE